MVLSNHIIKVIETEYSLIISDIQLANFIYDLRSIRLLCDEEVETLKDHCLTNKERIFQFIKILKTRSDDDFFRFCSVLKDNQVRNVQNLGRKLEKEASTSKPHGHATSTNQATEANSENLSELENVIFHPFSIIRSILFGETETSEIPLRNLPPTPSCHFIIRKNLVNSICDQLKIIHESSGHILIYGMAGSGKTVTVCQSVTRAADMGYFKTNGCYWMKIGNVSNVALFDQLKILSHDLGIEWNKSVQSVADLCAYLRNYLQGNSKLSDTLFIFDDIWKKDHYKYLSFAKKSIATSRFLFYENELSHRCIRLLERLTYDEAINLIALLRHDQDDQILRRNPLVKKVIDSCAGLPLAISLIGGCRLQTDKEWSEAKAIISRKSGKIKLANYDFNLYGTFKLSFDVLDEKERKLLESLSVFKRVRIPIQSIASLWNCDEQDADDILMELNNKSLLKYVKESKGYCVVHDLIVDFLQQQIYLQTLKQDYHKILNNKLMDGYSNRCEGRWNTLADDGYFYQNLIYHAILAENNEHLQNILTDFNWMTCKIKSDQTIYNLICDLTDYVNYLKARKESWKEFNQLLLLLKKHQAWLDISKIDVTQWIMCTDLTDSWMRERALQLAKDNTENEFSNLPYWNLSTISTNRTIQSTYYEACKGFGKNNNDEYISVSNHNVGHLRIIGTENNIREDCKIMIKDYETSQVLLQISTPNKWIRNVEISADGHTAAYYYRHQRKWIVYDVDKNEQMVFTTHNQEIHVKTDFNSLQFCPSIHLTSFIMTLSRNRHEFRIWEIKGHQILPTNKRISCEYKIEYCRWILVQGSFQILLWWRKYHYEDKNHKPKVENNWTNECQIEMWNLQTWSRMLSYQVPAFICSSTDHYIATTDVEHGLPLKNINYINNTSAYIILAYCSRQYPGPIGLLKIGKDDSHSNHSLIEFPHQFKPILPNIQFVRDILVSDHQFICIDYYREVHVLKIIGDQVQSYEKVNPSFFNKATLIPGSSRLLVYDYEEKHCIYEYNLQALQHGALTYHPKASVEILDVGLAYINNIPIIALLTNDADNVCKLQVSDYKSETSPRLFYHSLQNHNERCFLYNDLKSAIVVCIKKEEHSITVTKIDRILGRDDGSLHKELLDYALPEEYPNYYFVQTRFRKVDKTLTCIIKSWDENYGWGMLIITISVETREKMAYQQDHRYQDLNQIYADDFYLYTWQKEKDGYESNHAYSVQCYKFGDSKHQTQLVQVIPCDHWDGIVCKINLSSSGMTYDSQIKHSPLNMPREQLNECWREEDANVIKMFERQEKEIFLLENGNHRAVLNRDGEILAKLYKENSVTFNLCVSFFNNENLWSNKYFLVYNWRLSILFIYDAETLQQQINLPFPHFQIVNIQWNVQRSSFIARGKKDCCLIERI